MDWNPRTSFSLVCLVGEGEGPYHHLEEPVGQDGQYLTATTFGTYTQVLPSPVSFFITCGFTVHACGTDGTRSRGGRVCCNTWPVTAPVLPADYCSSARTMGKLPTLLPFGTSFIPTSFVLVIPTPALLPLPGVLFFRQDTTDVGFWFVLPTTNWTTSQHTTYTPCLATPFCGSRSLPAVLLIPHTLPLVHLPPPALLPSSNLLPPTFGSELRLFG